MEPLVPHLPAQLKPPHPQLPLPLLNLLQQPKNLPLPAAMIMEALMEPMEPTDGMITIKDVSYSTFFHKLFYFKAFFCCQINSLSGYFSR